MQNIMLCTDDSTLHLTIVWIAEQSPDIDLSVFVHLLNGDSVIAQADSSAPVYGWYPTSRWSPGEAVYDDYTLPYLPQSTAISVGMYTQPAPGQFQNYGTQTLPLTQVSSCN
jgi:hypothetical protein